MRRWLPWLPLLALGCGGTLGEARHGGALGAAPDSPRCVALSDRQTTWSGIAKGSAVLAGASGLGTIADDDPTLRTGLAIGAVAAGAVAAVAVAVADGTAQAWARECTQ